MDSPQTDEAHDEPRAAVELSVVIAARNAATTLGDQLQALDAQRPPFRWEIIVADNGSTDETVEIVRAMSRRMPELRLVEASARPGAAAARNIGVSAAAGRFLAFCDADDVVDAGWARAIGSALVRHTFVAGRLEWELLNDAVTSASRAHDAVDHLPSSTQAPQLKRAGACNMGVHAEVFRRVGGFCEQAPSMEDIDLSWRIQLSGETVEFVPTATVHYRLRRGLRAITSQAFGYGKGEHWLQMRYRLVRESLDADASSVATTSVEQRGSLRRVASRMRLTARQTLRARRREDVARLCWDVSFGLGYALGRFPEPAVMSANPGEALLGHSSSAEVDRDPIGVVAERNAATRTQK